uniref:Uncharacterized protein n=1 Tax=Anthurium amnicola TaxID=1678845 RepID=A0A1D1Y8R1_9ARAE
MNCLQIKACTLKGVKATPPSISHSHWHAPRPYRLPIHTFGCPKALPRLSCNLSEYQMSQSFDRRDKFQNDKEFAWEAIESTTQGLRKGPSVYDKLRKQMQRQEHGSGGGAGNHSGHGGGGGGSSGGPENDAVGFLNELMQVVLATIAFIFVYFYLIRGQETTRLARDYIRYLMGARATPRLKRAMDVWHKFLGKKEIKEAEAWLAHE